MRFFLLYVAIVHVILSSSSIWQDDEYSYRLQGLVSATDISFHRNKDEDTSLPLSSKYRANLRRLCDLLKQAESNPKVLPPEWQPKKAELTSLCAKLNKDDKMTQTSSFSLPSLFSNKLATLAVVLGAVGACVLFDVGGMGLLVAQAVRTVGRGLRGFGAGGRAQQRDGLHVPQADDLKAAREARLRRFDQ